MLVTFHNLSAPFTVECEGAYIEVEREKNGFEARWCGNRVTQVRPNYHFRSKWGGGMEAIKLNASTKTRSTTRCSGDLMGDKMAPGRPDRSR